MFGSFLSSAIKVVTLPVDAASAGLDLMSGGDGSKRSRTDGENPAGMIEELRDRVAESAKQIDD